MKRFTKVFAGVSPNPQRRSFNMKLTKKGSYLLSIAALLVFSVLVSAQGTCRQDCVGAAKDCLVSGSVPPATCLAQFIDCLQTCR